MLGYLGYAHIFPDILELAGFRFHKIVLLYVQCIPFILRKTFFFFIYRLQSQKSKLWSFLAVRVLALSRPEVSASLYKQRTKRERGERRKKNMYSQFRKTARCLDERSSKLGLFKSHDQ